MEAITEQSHEKKYTVKWKRKNYEEPNYIDTTDPTLIEGRYLIPLTKSEAERMANQMNWKYLNIHYWVEEIN